MLGTAPDTAGMAAMMAVMLMKKTDDRPTLADLAALCPKNHPDSQNQEDREDREGREEQEDRENQENEFDRAARVLQALVEEDAKTVTGTDPEIPVLSTAFREWCRTTGKNIAKSTCEIQQLLRALDGRYIEAGLSGSLALGNTRVLPTGRNLFPTDVEALPTKAAWKVGQELCDNLLKKYLEDENRFPESVGINLWSIDAFKSDGEIFLSDSLPHGHAPGVGRQRQGNKNRGHPPVPTPSCGRHRRYHWLPAPAPCGCGDPDLGHPQGHGSPFCRSCR